MNLKTWRLGSLALALGGLFTLSPFCLFAQTPVPTPLTINQTDSPIRVDGHLEDWPSTRMLVFNDASQIVSGKSFWKGVDSFQGRAFLTYDAQYLYVSAVVLKAGQVVNSNEGPSIWNGDCFELFLSTRPYSPNRHQTSHGDFHIGFSPGTDCKFPQIYCFNKNKDVPGGRLIARLTKKGYVLEGCIPLTFFDGLEIGPGNLNAFDAVLDQGGPLSGNRIVQMDLKGHALSSEDPSQWTEVQWTGATKVSIPEAQTTDLYASLVKDGVKGVALLGSRTLQGLVTDASGKPVAGAKVTTWPKTKVALTDALGRFQLEKIKVYDSTVFYGRKDGYLLSLAALPSKGVPVTLHLDKLPKGFEFGAEEVSSAFYGQTVRVPATGSLSDMLSSIQDRVTALHLNVIRLGGTERLLGSTPEAQLQALDQFVAFARAVGAEPIIELPVNRAHPEEAARWVAYCNTQKKYKVRYWAFGDEPDLYVDKGGDAALSDYNSYDYINDFRVVVNAAKKEDPSIMILGPEPAWKYQQGEEDWVSPLLRYDGDIVEAVSVHHYATLGPAPCAVTLAQQDLRQADTLLKGLRDKVSTNSDLFIPLMMTGGNTCPAPVTSKGVAVAGISITPTPTSKGVSMAGADSFWSAIWEAQWMGELMNNHAGMGFFSCLKGSGDTDLLAGVQPKPAYWPLQMLSGVLKGKVIQAQSLQPGVLVYATQDPQSHDVSILLISQTDRYCRPKLMLNGKDGDIVVDAGLDQRFGYEIPSYSINCLRIKADKSHDEAVWYTEKMALAGKEPQKGVIAPW